MCIRDRHDVEVANGLVFIGGSQHNVHVYQESDFTLLRTHMTKSGGDIQDFEVVGDRVYVTCHCFDFNYEYAGLQIWPNPHPAAVQNPVRAVYALDAFTGEFDTDFYAEFTGAAGAWAVHGHSTDGCLWVGGDMTTVGGAPIDRLARLCDAAGPGAAAGPKLTPPAPSSCSAVKVGSDAELSWPAVDYASHYVIYRNGNWLARVDAPVQSFTDTTTQVGATYTYSVATRSGGVNSNPRRTCNPSLNFAVNPVAPVSCSATESGGSAQVNWVRAAGDNATAFIVHRSRDGGPFFWRAKVNAPGTSFVDNNVVAGSTYTYRVFTQAGSVNSAQTLCAPSVTIGAGSAPVAPVSCSASVSGGVVTVNWVRAANDNATAFIVHRQLNAGQFFWLAKVNAPGTSRTDANVVAGSTYTYQVRTQAGSTNSAPITCSPPVTI